MDEYRFSWTWKRRLVRPLASVALVPAVTRRLWISAARQGCHSWQCCSPALTFAFSTLQFSALTFSILAATLSCFGGNISLENLCRTRGRALALWRLGLTEALSFRIKLDVLLSLLVIWIGDFATENVRLIDSGLDVFGFAFGLGFGALGFLLGHQFVGEADSVQVLSDQVPDLFFVLWSVYVSFLQGFAESTLATVLQRSSQAVGMDVLLVHLVGVVLLALVFFHVHFLIAEGPKEEIRLGLA